MLEASPGEKRLEGLVAKKGYQSAQGRSCRSDKQLRGLKGQLLNFLLITHSLGPLWVGW